jgi:ParB family chromosome partitioning protein
VAKFGLGKGLDALLPLDGEAAPERVDDRAAPASPAEAAPTLPYLPLDKLIANPNQPRKNFDEEKLRELADSIREHGIIEPIIVEDAGNGFYTIVAGERRSRAARMAGLTEAPALIRSYSGAKRMEVSLIENVQRADLNPVEEASAYRRLMELTGLSQDDMAARVGKNRSTVANALRLLKLPQPMLDALETGALSPGHGRALLSVLKPDDQNRLFQEILAETYSVRESERRAAALNTGAAVLNTSAAALNTSAAGEEERPSVRERSPKGGTAGKRDPELTAIEERFIAALGTKVAITGTLERGSIQIDYYSMDDLERLLDIFKKENA